MHVTAIIAAGGYGRRFGAAGLKQLVSIGGRSVLEWSVASFLTHAAIEEVVVALPAELVAQAPVFLRKSSKPVRIVPGGARRQDSVANAFRAISDQAELVVVHDGARPFASEALIARTIVAAAETGAALAARPSQDTVKQGALEDLGSPAGAREWFVRATLPRESVFLAQTPQAFRREVLREALAAASADAAATDEATLVERAGYPVRLVEGEATNIKITTLDDLPIAEAIAAGIRGGGTARIGIGYDLHRLVEGRPLVLGGVTIPFDRGLLGHSDADAVCHAIADAVLGAAAMGDIGRHFPDDDPRWLGASSVDLLRRAVEMIERAGYAVESVDAVVIAERPKLRPYIEAMRTCVAAALGVAPDRVSIKGKTSEGVGELGRGEAMAVHAVALVGAARAR